MSQTQLSKLNINIVRALNCLLGDTKLAIAMIMAAKPLKTPQIRLPNPKSITINQKVSSPKNHKIR